VPRAICKAIVAKYKGSAGPGLVGYREFAGRTHRLVSQDGSEEIADYALDLALGHATEPGS
jgi:hypothetical protein